MSNVGSVDNAGFKKCQHILKLFVFFRKLFLWMCFLSQINLDGNVGICFKQSVCLVLCFCFLLYLRLSSSCVLHLFCLCHLPLSFWQFRKQSVLLVLFFSFLCVYPCLGPMSCLCFCICICLCFKINLNLSLGIYWRQSVLLA